MKKAHFQPQVINAPPPTEVQLEVVSQSVNCVKIPPDGTVEVHCIQATSINNYNLGQFEESIKTIEIILRVALIERTLFNFASLTRPNNIVFRLPATSPGKMLKADENLNLNFDVTRIGQNVDSLTISSFNLSFFATTGNNILLFNIFVLSNLISLGESAGEVDISPVRNLDFDNTVYYNEFLQSGGTKESITINFNNPINDVTITAAGVVNVITTNPADESTVNCHQSSTASSRKCRDHYSFTNHN